MFSMLNLNVFLVCVEAFVFLDGNKAESKKSRIGFLVITCMQCILLSGLRHSSVGPDTYNYIKMFDRINGYSWEYVLDHLKNMFEYSDSVEPGYMLFVKIFQIFSKSSRAYLIFFACFVNIPLFVMFYKMSKNVFISVLVYLVLFYSFFSTTGLRQTTVIVLVNFIGYQLVVKRKLIPFLILVAVCYTIHRSAIAVLPLYFIAYKKVTPKYLLCCVAVIAVLFVFRKQYTQFIAAVGGYDKYGEQYTGAGTWNYTFVTFAMLGVAMWKRRHMLAMDDNAILYLNACLVSCALLPITFIDPTNMRVVFYYSIFNMLLVPDIIEAFEGRDKQIVFLIIVFLMLAMYLKKSNPYYFYWQPGPYGIRSL